MATPSGSPSTGDAAKIGETQEEKLPMSVAPEEAIGDKNSGNRSPEYWEYMAEEHGLSVDEMKDEFWKHTAEVLENLKPAEVKEESVKQEKAPKRGKKQDEDWSRNKRKQRKK